MKSNRDGGTELEERGGIRLRLEVDMGGRRDPEQVQRSIGQLQSKWKESKRG